ncbi:MAG: J domain-containing protein [Desulfobacterales bacterium]|nr:J domain-containing protein [Desulfobacterales bacterium]
MEVNAYIDNAFAAAHRRETERRRCLSCGTDLGSARRRYCSVGCRQDLRRKLNARTGLLKALNTRYATFYFTETAVILDILAHDSLQIFSFIYPRTPGASPSKDFCRLSNMLGNTWWNERRRTNRKYLANQRVFGAALCSAGGSQAVRPLEIRTPAVNGSHLVHLRLRRQDLDNKKLLQIIKTAFRNQAMKHHPDRGGDNRSFRKIFRAYEEMLCWAESPTFITRRGFPDKWFYDGSRNRWVQPTPATHHAL